MAKEKGSTSDPLFQQNVVRNFRAGIHEVSHVELAPTTSDDPEGRTREHWQQVRVDRYTTWLDDAVALARKAYESEGLPSGADNWTRRDDNAGWLPFDWDAADQSAKEEAWERGLVAEHSLWLEFGKEVGGVAWAAGQVLGIAGGLAGLLRLSADPDVTGSSGDRLIVDLNFMGAQGFELGIAMEALRAKTEIQIPDNRTAEELMIKAIGSRSGPMNRGPPPWESAILPEIVKYCEGNEHVTYSRLVRVARKVDEDHRKRGQPGISLPYKDESIEDGLKRMEKRGDFVRPTTARNGGVKASAPPSKARPD